MTVCAQLIAPITFETPGMVLLASSLLPSSVLLWKYKCMQYVIGVS